jgi:regulator-associated protein of mTOR
VGIFPYVLKLLQTTAFDLRKPLIFIWTKILAWDASSHVQNDLIKDGGHLYFIKHLGSGMEHIDVKSYTQAAFIISAICNNHLKGQVLCAQAGLFQVCMKLLMSENVAQEVAAEKSSGSADGLHLIVWLLICIGKLSENLPEVITLALQENVSWDCTNLLYNTMNVA